MGLYGIIGHVQLRQVTPAILDNMFQKLFEKAYHKARRYCQRIMVLRLKLHENTII